MSGSASKKMIDENEISRRQFLKIAGTGILAILTLGLSDLLGGCEKGGQLPLVIKEARLGYYRGDCLTDDTSPFASEEILKQNISDVLSYDDITMIYSNDCVEVCGSAINGAGNVDYSVEAIKAVFKGPGELEEIIEAYKSNSLWRIISLLGLDAKIYHPKPMSKNLITTRADDPFVYRQRFNFNPLDIEKNEVYIVFLQAKDSRGSIVYPPNPYVWLLRVSPEERPA